MARLANRTYAWSLGAPQWPPESINVALNWAGHNAPWVNLQNDQTTHLRVPQSPHFFLIRSTNSGPLCWTLEEPKLPDNAVPCAGPQRLRLSPGYGMMFEMSWNFMLLIPSLVTLQGSVNVLIT
jgi:hypothetical protein